MCQTCGHPLAVHYTWGDGNRSGSECSTCLNTGSRGVLSNTGGPQMHEFVPPDGYSVTSVAVGEKGVKLVLVLTSSLVTP